MAAGSCVGGEGNDGVPERRDSCESTLEGLTLDEADEFRQCRDALEEQCQVQDEVRVNSEFISE